MRLHLTLRDTTSTLYPKKKMRYYRHWCCNILLALECPILAERVIWISTPNEELENLDLLGWWHLIVEFLNSRFWSCGFKVYLKWSFSKIFNIHSQIFNFHKLLYQKKLRFSTQFQLPPTFFPICISKRFFLIFKCCPNGS